MRAPFGDPLDEDQEPDPAAQRAALDALMAPPPPAIAPPKATGYGADDAGALALAQAQHKDAARRLAANTSNAMYATFARKPMPADLQTSDAANLLERRKGADDEEALAGRQAAMAKNAERADPNSQNSQVARALLRKSLPEVADSIGPQFERMSHATIMENFPFMKAIIDAHHRRQAIDRPLSAPPIANIKMPSELDEDKLRAEIDLKKAEAERARRGPVAKGPDPIREKQYTLREKKFNVQLNQNEVPGTEQEDPEHPHYLQPGQAADLQQQSGAVAKLHGLLKEAGDIYARNGGRFPNPASTDLARLRTLLGLAIPQAITTGGFKTPTNAHVEMQQHAVSDPGDLLNWLNTGRLPAQLGAVQDEADNGYRAALHAVQHRLKGSASPAKPPPWPGAVRIKNAEGKMGWLHPEDPVPPGSVEVSGG